MIELLIALFSLSNAASALNASDAFNDAKTYMELPLVEANKFATEKGLSNKTRASMKAVWFLSGIFGDKYANALNLSPDEDAAMAEADSTRPRNSSEFFAELMKKSPHLGARFINVLDLKQYAELTPEGQAFFNNMAEYIWKFNDDKLTPSSAGEIALGLIDKFNALSDDAKEHFQKAYPAAAVFLTSKETVKRLQER